MCAAAHIASGAGTVARFLLPTLRRLAHCLGTFPARRAASARAGDAQRGIRDGTDAMPQSQSTEQADFYQLADPDFLAERRRVREALEHAPEHSPGRARLAARYA